jgi:tetratricopeptide (TPR) repeat protein
MMKRQRKLKNRLSALLWAVLAASLLISVLVSTAAAQDPTGRPSDPSAGGSKRKKKPKPEDTTPEAITITLTVLTQPGGCEVYINGNPRGTSDADGKIQFNKLAQGHYTIEARKAGFVAGSREFEAGSEAPTVVIKLAADLGDKLKQFDSLMLAGTLIGPASPSAFDIADELGKSFPDRAEVIKIRSTLFQRLTQSAEESATRTIKWIQASRDDMSNAQILAAKAEALSPDDKRAQALDLFFQGALALRDWQTGQQVSSPTATQSDAGLADARTKLEKAVQLQDSLAAAQYQLGVALLLSNDSTRAEAAFGKAAQLQPGWAVARIGIGDSLFAEGKRKDAVSQYRQAVGLDPNSSAAHAGLGLSLAMTGQSKDGMKEIDQAITLDPSAALPHYDLGLVLADSKKKKDRDKAEEELKKAIEMNSKNLEFPNSAAQRALANMGDGKKK